METMNTFSDDMKKARLSAGMTQQRLADLVGSVLVYINRLERNKQEPSLEMARKIAKVLRVEIVFGLRSN